MRNGQKTKKNFTSWKIGDYILQLSVVVLGIIITFTISDLVAERAKEKEIEKAMQLIKSECELNIKRVQDTASIFHDEQHASTYIISFRDHMSEANTDSLLLYSSYPFYSHLFAYHNDAMEMLKTSSLIQHVDNKDLVLQIVKSYTALENLKVFHKWYYDVKEKIGDRINMNKNFTSSYEALYNTNGVQQLWDLYLDNKDIYDLLKFISAGANFDSNTNDPIQMLEQTIIMINKEYQ